MRTSPARILAALAAVTLGATLLAGCEAALPSRQPDAVGTVGEVSTSDGVTVLSFVPDAGYEYFLGTLFWVDDSVEVIGPEGVSVDASEIVLGAEVEVWTEACAESFPVQCDVVAVRWTGPTL
ncbi:hypothetical protein [Demequina sp. NBRC 110052]|uniref:hypothetical protein n=1 Tax=Demequina sp. NBRC 110052 TaxID=1570341 RepID=UPI00117FDB56|nr:hypothetical protein [Demequina sp. NBRC 110052]